MKGIEDNKKKGNHKFFWRLFFVIFILLAIFIGGYFLLRKLGVWEYINSIEKIQRLVEMGGVFSFLIFMLLQILQTTILQIPAVIVTAAGAVIFGRWTAFGLSYISVLIGSVIMFWIGRKFGRKFLNWLAGDDAANRWIKRMSQGKYLFFLMMMLPLFPDDVLCTVAGCTNMSFGFFMWTNVLARGVGIATTVFFASGEVIPFHSWGLAVWGVIAVVVVLMLYLSVKYQEKIDNALAEIFKQNKTKK